MESLKKTELNNKNLLFYGDILLIKSELNPSLHNKYFFVDYIGLDSIELIEKSSFKKESIGIDPEEGTLRDETIQTIKIIYRNPERGYARQNKLLPGVYLEILFDTKIRKVITGKIVNLEEDMIEILILESKKSIFIDFAYRGLSPDYKINNIKILDSELFNEEANHEQNDEQQEEKDNIEDDENEEVFNIENIEFNEDIKETVTFDVQLSENEYMYDIKEQKDFLLNDLLSTIATKDRKPKLMSKLNKLVERFEQILKMYSIYDSSSNIIEKPFNKKELQTFLNNSKNVDFKRKVDYIIPCIKDLKKYIHLVNDDMENDEGNDDDDDRDDEDQYIDPSFVELLINEFPNASIIDFNKDIKQFYDNLKNVKKQEVENNYKYYNDVLNSYFIPYNKDINIENDTYFKPIDSVKNSNIPFLYLNNENVPSSVVFMNNKPQINTNITDTYIHSDEKMFFSSYLFMPNYFIQQSKMYSPTSQIILKSLLNRKYKLNDVIFNNEDITTVNIDETINTSSDLYQSGSFKFDKPYIYLNNKENKDDYFNILSPDSNDILNILKDYPIISYRQTLDIFDTYKINYFNINNDDLNFIKNKISESIKHKKREYVANQRIFSKRLKPLYNIDLKFIKDEYEKIGSEYELYSLIDYNNYNIQEILHIMNVIDNLNYMIINYVLKNRNLYNTISNEEITKIIGQIKDGTYNINNISCTDSKESQKNIVKIYQSLNELTQDNYSNVYVDSNINNEFKQDLEYYYTIKDKNTSSKLRTLLYNKFAKEKNLNDENINIYINYIIQEQKPISEGDYAIVFVNNTKDFYKWVGDHWEKEDDNCIEEKECITSPDDSQDSDCKKIGSLKTIRDKDLINSFVEKIQNDKLIDVEFIMRKIDSLNGDYLKELNFKLRIIKYLELKLHNRNISFIDQVKVRNLISSPYEKLKERILSIQDLHERYKLIIQFVKNYTIQGDGGYYLYCVETNIKLLPKIVFQMAEAYFMDDLDYTKFINQLCLTQGEESDDGDCWVDKYTGYVIKRKDFEEENMVDDGGNLIINRSDIGDVGIQELPSREILPKENDKTLGYKFVRSLCLTIMNFTGIQFKTDDFEDLLNHLYEKVKINADKSVLMDINELKKEDLKIKTKIDTIILFYCASFLFIYFQTNIPNINIRKTFHGCKKSFDGFPLIENDDHSGLSYICCILTKIKSNTSPWSAISKLNETKLKDKMVTFIKKEIISDSKIELRLIKKRGYLRDKQANLNQNLNLNENNYTFINVFKPMDLIKFRPPQLFDTAYQPLSKTFFSEYERIIGGDDMNGKETKKATLQSHIDLHGLELQKNIHNKLQQNELLLNGANGEPFQQNACCNNVRNNPIYYFNENNDLVELIKLNQLYIRKKYKKEILKKPHNISFDINFVKNEDKFNLKHNYSEETIYKGFIRFLNFDFPNDPIPKEIEEALKLTKPNYDTYKHEEYKFLQLFDESEKYLEEKMNELKKQNYIFTEKLFKQLLFFVHSKNIISNNEINVNVENSRISESLITMAQSCDLDTLIYPYIKYVKSNRPFEFSETSVTALRDFSNNIYDKIKEKSDYITNLFLKITDLEKSKKINYTNLLSEMLLNNSFIKEKINLNEILSDFLLNDEFDNKLTLIHYFIKLITIIIPNKILNISKDKLNEKNVPKHWDLSSKHESDVSSFSQKYNKLLSKIIDNDKIKDFLSSNQIQLNEIYNVYVNGFYGYYTSSYDSIKKIDPVLMYQISLYFYYTALSMYIKPFETKSKNISGLKLLICIFEIQKEFYNTQHLSYNSIISKVNKYSEGEKERIKTRLSDFTDEERRTEDELKSRKLGIWNVGIQSGIVKYNKNFYDKERQQVIEIERELDGGSFFESVNDPNNEFNFISNLGDDYEGNEQHNMDELNEVYNMSNYANDDDYGEQDDIDYEISYSGDN